MATSNLNRRLTDLERQAQAAVAEAERICTGESEPDETGVLEGALEALDYLLVQLDAGNLRVTWCENYRGEHVHHSLISFVRDDQASRREELCSWLNHVVWEMLQDGQPQPTTPAGFREVILALRAYAGAQLEGADSEHFDPD